MSENVPPFVLGREVPPADQRVLIDALERAVRERTALVPKVGLVLGSGLGGLADQVECEAAIPFGELPGWPAATAPGHQGRLLFGRLGGVPVVVEQGRFHMYEGHSAGFVVQPVLLMRRLGAEIVVLTNAAGGVNPDYPPGTLMIIRDHLNLTGRNPLCGPNDDAAGPRFPDMTTVWDAELRERLRRAGDAEGVPMTEGIYACLTGPSYETPAEIRLLRTLGADAVGMSTVPEALGGRWAGLRLAGVSLVTNPGAGYTGLALSHEEVLEAADKSGPALGRALRRFVSEL